MNCIDSHSGSDSTINIDDSTINSVLVILVVVVIVVVVVVTSTRGRRLCFYLCLFVSLGLGGYSKSYERIQMKFWEGCGVTQGTAV